MAQYDLDAARIARQRAIAKALMETGNQSFDPAESAGRLVYARSPLEHLAGLANTAGGVYLDRKVNKAEANLVNQRNAELEQQKSGLLDALTGKSQKGVAPEVVDGVPMEGVNIPTVTDPLSGQQMDISGPDAELNKRRAMMAGILQGADPQASVNMLREQAISAMQPKAPIVLAKGSDLIDPTTHETLASNQEPVKESPEDRLLINIVDPKSPGGYRTIKRADWKGEQEWQKPPAASGNSANDVTVDPAAIDLIARDWMLDPASLTRAAGIGTSGTMIRNKATMRAAAIMKDAGMTHADLTRLRAVAKGEMKSIGDMTQMRNTVESYEKLARFNGDRLLQLVDKVDTTGVPALEGLIRAGKVKVGSEDAAEFMSVLKTYQTEVARIITQPRLTGQLTDTQIEEMKKVVDGSATAPQLRRVINRLNLEMDARKAGIQATIDSASAQLATPGSQPSAQPNPAAPAATSTPPGATPAADGRPAGVPPDAQQAPDGHWYTKGKDGKYIQWS